MINGKSKMEFAKIYTNITRVRKNNSRQIISKNALLQKKEQLHNVPTFEFAKLFLSN